MFRSFEVNRGFIQRKRGKLKKAIQKSPTCLREAASAEAGNAAGGLFQHSPFSLNSPTIRLKRSKHLTQTSTSS
ncbi:MAG: hypothetical protein ACE1ZW_03040, partial [Nitrospirales bacterium]